MHFQRYADCSLWHHKCENGENKQALGAGIIGFDTSAWQKIIKRCLAAKETSVFGFLSNVRPKRFLTRQFGLRQTGGPIKPKRAQKAHLEVECLESRLVPSTGWPNAAILDFGGGDIGAAR